MFQLQIKDLENGKKIKIKNKFQSNIIYLVFKMYENGYDFYRNINTCFYFMDTQSFFIVSINPKKIITMNRTYSHNFRPYASLLS